MVASIYTRNGDEIATGLAPCTVSDEAVRAARRIAAQRREAVVLDDADGSWLIPPDDGDGIPFKWPGVDCEPARRPAWLRSTTTVARLRPGVYSIRRDGREVATVEGTRADAWAKVRDLDKAAR